MSLASRLKGQLDRHRAWRVFDRPVFILAAPRSGSTLLRDMLDKHPDLLAWPREAHAAFAAARAHVAEEGHRWEPSVADEPLRRALTRELYQGMMLRRHEGGVSVSVAQRLALRPVRLLEKTPANILRVGALARLYPDAKLVFLHRDAPSSIASLMESWETPTGAHARFFVHGEPKEWMMLAAPGWVDLVANTPAEKSAFQWRTAMQYALDDLNDIPTGRVVTVSYEDLLSDPTTHLRRVLEHCELRPDPTVLAMAAVVGNRGSTSLSAPRPEKWREREAEIAPQLPALATLRAQLGYPS